VPELPDVEGFRRVLQRHGAGRRIARVAVFDTGVLRNTSARELAGALEGQRFESPDRHGKWLLAHTTGPTLIVHFGMSGALRWCPDDSGRHKHDRAIFVLDRGELRYRDLRKLRGLWLAHTKDDCQHILGEQGPDALAIGPAEFHRRLTRRKRTIKPALTDQRLIAGLGNLLCDEILWQAHVYPELQTSDLSDADVSRLHRIMRRVLRQSLPEGCVPGKPRWLTGHRNAGGRCPRHHSPLRHKPVGGRTTYWCPKCQPAP